MQIFKKYATDKSPDTHAKKTFTFLDTIIYYYVLLVIVSNV